MGRELKSNSHNEAIFFDKISNSEITLFYKNLTNTERVKFRSAIVNKLMKGGETEELNEIQLQWAEKILSGFKKGNFLLDGKEISSNKKDKDYYAGWKGLIKESAPEFLIALSDLVYEPILLRTKGIKRPLLKSSETTSPDAPERKEKHA